MPGPNKSFNNVESQSLDAEKFVNGDSIHIFGSNNNFLEKLDPSTTTTPIQDAYNLDGASNILLPATTVEDTGPLNPPTGTSIIGMGRTNTNVTITDETNDGFLIDSNERDVFIHGFTLNGGSGRSANSAIRFTANCDGWNVGRIMFKNWEGSDPVVHFDTGHPFSFNWGRLRGFTSAEADFIKIDSLGGGGGSMEVVYGNGNNSSSNYVVDMANTKGHVNIGVLNNGGTYNGSLSKRAQLGGAMVIGRINHEQSTSSSHVVTQKRDGRTVISSVWQESDVDQVYRLAFDNGNMILPEPRSVGSVSNNIINVTKSPDAESWYHGPESDILRNYGSNGGWVRPMKNAGPPGDSMTEIRYGVATNIDNNTKFSPSGTSRNSAEWDFIDVHIAEYDSNEAQFAEVSDTFTTARTIEVRIYDISDGTQFTADSRDIGYLCMKY